MIDKITPEKIIEARKSSGFTQLQMSKLLDCGLRHYQKLESTKGALDSKRNLSGASLKLFNIITSNDPVKTLKELLNSFE